ncbi:hypothetical protein RZE82_07905 [Mollicutes bacterium LVI A0039]|nr:hypothetical protein RZE82_07905 [Mollicutes bacterium LVI A0039]
MNTTRRNLTLDEVTAAIVNNMSSREICYLIQLGSKARSEEAMEKSQAYIITLLENQSEVIGEMYLQQNMKGEENESKDNM